MGRKMPRVRIINFSSVEIKTFPSVKLRDSPMDSAIATVRKYADQPVVYVADAGQYEHVAGIAATLATMHSPCYPHAVYFVGGPSPAPAIPGADVFVLADPEGLEDRIAAYALAAFVFDKRRLIIENENALPDRVDVLIVGGGITALYAAGRMQQKGLGFCIVEKDEMIGGIWSKYANATSQVNTSEGAYRLFDPEIRANRDHSSTAQMLENISTLADGVGHRIYTRARVESIEKAPDGYATTIVRDGDTVTVNSKGVLLAVNDRIGEPRAVTWHNQDRYNGVIVDGYADATAGIDWEDKKVVVVGMGAFAVENARTALEAGAEHVTVACRRHGTVCPKIIDYLNFSTPYDEHFEHGRKSNIRNMMLWERLYDQSGATQPECWMGKIKHTGHTISVSDIWFIAHHLSKMETVAGSVSEMYETGVMVEARKIEADIVVNCVGFHRNASTAKELSGYSETLNINYLDEDFMYLADAFIDDDAFNSFFGSSVLEMTSFYLDVYLEFFGDPSSYYEMIETPGIEKIDIENRAWSHYISGAMALVKAYPRFAEMARRQIDRRTERFLEAHDLDTYIAENKREWYDTHTLLAGRELPEDECLPYVFERLAERRPG